MKIRVLLAFPIISSASTLDPFEGNSLSYVENGKNVCFPSSFEMELELNEDLLSVKLKPFHVNKFFW